MIFIESKGNVLDAIRTAFENLQSFKQFNVRIPGHHLVPVYSDPNCTEVLRLQKMPSEIVYQIDLYFPTIKLAIEYDDGSYKTYEQKEDDRIREENISNRLGCSFLRINKHDDIFWFINKMRVYHCNYLLEQSDKKWERETTRLRTIASEDLWLR